MSFRSRTCYILARLRIHNPDCEHCSARQTCGSELLKRLQELRWQTAKTEEEADSNQSAVRK
jgi:positive regulator of sigma E activity